MTAHFLIALALSLAPQQVGTQTQTQIQTRQQAPPRDARSTDVKGTGVIRGKISNTEGRPLRRVQLRLSGEPVPDGRSASTNGLGKFEIRDLPPGRYSLSATRAGYLSMSYGQSRPGEPGRPIELANTQVLDDADMVLPHSALIGGRIFDEAGEPLAGANVMVMQLRFFNGKKRLVPTRGNTISDDTGQYRLSGLEPGEYYVQASSRETWESDPPDKQMLGFLPTYYPSSPNTGEAQRVRVRMGQELTGIDIGLQPGKVVRISGTAVNSQGIPLAGENIGMSFEIRGETFMSSFGMQGTKVNPDGTFLFRNIAPAEYHLNVRTASTPERPLEAASVIVSALGGDVEGVNIVTSAAGGVAGRVIVEGDAPLPATSPLTRMFVRAQAVDRDTQINIGGTPDNGHVRDDGTFELKGVIGQNRLTVGPLPDGWAVRRVEQGGRDLTIAPLDTQGQALDGLTIILTNRFPKVTGALRDEKGNSIVSGTAILFPEDPGMLNEDLRMIRTGRADQTGLFTIKAVRPGDYLAVAVPTVQNNQWNDPDYLESLRAQAKRITLSDGDTKQIELVVKNPV